VEPTMKRQDTAAKEQFEQQGWDLSELLPRATEEELSRRITQLDGEVEKLESKRLDLGPKMEPAALLEILRTYEALVETMHLVSAYAALWFAADTQSEEALTFRNRVQHALTGFSNRILFFSLWWKSLDDEVAERLLPPETEPDLRHYLQDARRLRPYVLDERSEQVVNLKDANGIDAVLTLYSMLTNRLEFRLEVEGELRTMTRDEVMSNVFSPRPELREAAYQELFRVYRGEAKILAQIYANRVRDWRSEHVELRGYDSPVAVRNVANDLPDAAIDTLLDVARENVPLFQRYFRLKAGWLGMERLRRYDLYAPLAASERKIPYGEAVGMVLETLGDFHPVLGEQAERVFAERHIDSEIRKGKKGGAFCATVLPRLTPWLLLNYTGRVRDVATLAHELGHAVHSMLAEGHSVLTQQPSLPLAETASVFSEMLLTDRLLEAEQDPLVRRELLAAAVDDIYATVLRQAYFTRFELAAHEAVLAGQPPEALNALYRETLNEQFGDAVEVAPEFESEWIAIPHIYQTPFYCYAYSFGQLLVLALYRRYKEEGEGFIPGYLKLLSYGGSARPERILSEADVDVMDPDFWRGGFAVVSGMVDELEEL
jgi:oligoendopeptidase F